MTSFVLAVDPGVKKSAFVIFKDGFVENYVSCSVSGFSNFFCKRVAPDFDLDAVVCERPRAYAGKSRRVNDLLDLSVTLGEVKALAVGTLFYTVPPQDWKGTVPKNIMTERLRVVFEAETKPHSPKVNHNILDAYGLGTWFLKQKNKEKWRF